LNKEQTTIAEDMFDAGLARADLPATDQIAFLNTGTCGPLPRSTIEIMHEQSNLELLQGRIALGGYATLREHIAALRSELASFVGADPAEIAFTHNTTEGMNVATWGLTWQPGDTVVTTNLEHAGGLLPLYQIHRRLGVKVVFAPCGMGEPDRVLDAMREAIRPGTKLVVVSHVNYQTGAVLPLPEVAAMAHSVGAKVLVDGAQSVGAMPLDLRASGADFYAFPGQKWLCGPEGTGALYVRKESLEALQPTFVGGFGTIHEGFGAGNTEFEFAAGAQRYEVGSVYRPAVAGLANSLNWIRNQGDIFGAISRLAEYCHHRAGEIRGVQVLTPDQGQRSGLISLRIPDVDVVSCVEFLRDRKIAVRSIPDNGALRISCGFYNTPAEIDATVAAVAKFLRT